MSFHRDQQPRMPGKLATARVAVAYSIVVAALGVLLVARWAIRMLPAADYEVN